MQTACCTLTLSLPCKCIAGEYVMEKTLLLAKMWCAAIQVAVLAALVTIAGGPDGSLIGSGWVVTLRVLSALQALQVWRAVEVLPYFMKKGTGQKNSR